MQVIRGVLLKKSYLNHSDIGDREINIKKFENLFEFITSKLPCILTDITILH